ncbi:DNA-3-methyladenine glycosylase I [Saccharophagus degradans]|uniref:DNA-3-methyladenine glycosylase I n=1 Tax=Saccharophagus degradans TaxID=86304 RepID=UPI003A800A95
MPAAKQPSAKKRPAKPATKTADPAQACPWCGSDPIYVHYHDTEWGVPEYDNQALLAKLILDGAQAGLSWITILKKRDGYYRAFDQFNPEKMARYTDAKLEKLMLDDGIVRNRLKIKSARQNAQAYLRIMKNGGPNGEKDFSEFLWSFVGGQPIQNNYHSMSDVPAYSLEAEAMSKALKKAGFNFVGPTIVYAFMQAVGMVNDHLVSCPRHAVLS